MRKYPKTLNSPKTDLEVDEVIKKELKIQVVKMFEEINTKQMHKIFNEFKYLMSSFN